MKTLIALVGPSRAGKTSLILEALKAFPEKLTAVRSLTTRPRREGDASDDIFYEFVDTSVFSYLSSAGEFVEEVVYGGNHYGVPKRSLLGDAVGILAATEHGINALRKYVAHVLVVRIWPMDNVLTDDTSRLNDDATRIKFGLRADYDIVNPFSPGGKEIATKMLIEYITPHTSVGRSQ